MCIHVLRLSFLPAAWCGSGLPCCAWLKSWHSYNDVCINMHMHVYIYICIYIYIYSDVSIYQCRRWWYIGIFIKRHCEGHDSYACCSQQLAPEGAAIVHQSAQVHKNRDSGFLHAEKECSTQAWLHHYIAYVVLRLMNQQHGLRLHEEGAKSMLALCENCVCV